MKNKSYLEVLRASKNVSESTFADTIVSLARSQGFYGRLIRDIESLDKESFAQLRQELRAQGFAKAIDVVLWLES